MAQTFGVRAHLLGIKPTGGSQPDNLMMEADTCHEWDKTVIERWMHCDDLATAAPVAGSCPGFLQWVSRRATAIRG